MSRPIELIPTSRWFMAYMLKVWYVNKSIPSMAHRPKKKKKKKSLIKLSRLSIFLARILVSLWYSYPPSSMPMTLFSDLVWRLWGKQACLTRLRLYRPHGQDDILMTLTRLVENSRRTRRGDRAHRPAPSPRAVRGGTAKKRKGNRRCGAKKRFGDHSTTIPPW